MFSRCCSRAVAVFAALCALASWTGSGAAGGRGLLTYTVLVETVDTPLTFEKTGYDAIIVTITTPDSPLMFETKL
jgi:hypothetical protein